MTTLAEQHDHLLLDLDGTLYHGPRPIESAVRALRGGRVPVTYVTNNASRSPADVAAALAAMGYEASAHDVATSAQAAAELLAERLDEGARVLVVGAEALADEVRLRGLVPVRAFAEAPHAVVQGHSPQTDWSQLAEAALAIRAGALWVACNVDPTLPTDRGLLPGNGSMVAALRTATDQEPEIAGKPAAALLQAALRRRPARSPLVVGDRLDTDIAGANAVGLPSLLVLTGVSTPEDVLAAEADLRPTYVAQDLSALGRDADSSSYGSWCAGVTNIR
ncbi:HAD-superfamily hydrolase, subfamily IIA [Segniliparus rotundus DSM 44985]|uniref:HAD-superfamily hydrolase, subfamily IIA n=1 Tax=Segniliparus rotundus (strain ATCC BAA-972 / CDC 1076 / CIP 108378 / DSM 44985 / JCM 13578) TaxID=640132 RepID=D6Z7U4_SEGRD|nr:HAD-superfamily hydrolase, subfamily IIA [Segniliparus rotundus DSM 44985]